MPNAHYQNTEMKTPEELADLVSPYALKMQWFLNSGYVPHYFQILFHTMQNDKKHLCRFRNLVAGRRGGKTLSAAWELLYYVMHPSEFHHDFHGEKKDAPLWAWCLAKDHPTGLAALITFRECLAQAGLKSGVDFKEHRGNKWIEFTNGGFLQFKSADDPQSLRGAGLHMLWIDEASFIPTAEAYQVVSPALGDHRGAVICTTTPNGKNWYYDEFFGESSQNDPEVGRVEYTSIHNPYFPKEVWERERERYHPLLFKQEYMAAFDAMAGKELSGEWLRYYTWADLPKKENSNQYDLEMYIGVDPAISLSETADRFAMACIAKRPDGSQAYLYDIYAGRIPFPEQLEKIQEWFIKYRPVYIGIESNAFQQALAQQAMRMEGLPPIIPMFAKGQKSIRILSMAPSFKIGRIQIREDHRDFIDEWLDYDSQIRNPKDDCLDAVEIALRTAGVLLPDAPISNDFEPPRLTLEEEAIDDRTRNRDNKEFYDDTLGSEW